MSSTILLNSVRASLSENITSFGVYRNEEGEDLADIVRKILHEKNLSHNEVSRRASARGFHIAQSYVSRIVSRGATNITVDKLRALAAGLDEPVEVLMVPFGDLHSDPAAAIEEALVNALPYKFGSLSEKDKEQIRPMLEMIMREIDERARRSHS